MLFETAKKIAETFDNLLQWVVGLCKPVTRHAKRDHEGG